MFFFAILLTAVLAPTVFVMALLLANFLTGGLVWALGPVIPIAMAVLCLVGTWNVVREKLRKSKAFH